MKSDAEENEILDKILTYHLKYERVDMHELIKSDAANDVVKLGKHQVKIAKITGKVAAIGRVSNVPLIANVALHHGSISPSMHYRHLRWR
ncbi:hypothetical protein P7H17_27095 [Paenibacillus larvae]|nr:hypothetical protein [Paenibacillus larvae]MDT2289000.1 hypothetical protein [Paenibacillus larvae]